MPRAPSTLLAPKLKESVYEEPYLLEELVCVCGGGGVREAGG